MVGGDHVDRAVGDAFQQRVPVGGVPQRRVHLEPPVLLQVGVGQKQVVGRGLAGHVHALGLRPADQRHALLRGYVAYVVGAAGLPGQPQVALDRPPFALRADARVAVGPGVGAVVDVPAPQQGIVLAVRRDQFAQRFRLAHRRAHHVRALHAAPVVGEGDDVRRQRVHVGKLAPGLVHGDRAVGIHADAGVPGDDVQLDAEVFGAVRHGVQIRHRAHGGITAAGGRQRAGADGFLIRKTRLAQVHVNICETGQYGQTGIAGANLRGGRYGNDFSALQQQLRRDEPALHEGHDAADPSLQVRSLPFLRRGAKKNPAHLRQDSMHGGPRLWPDAPCMDNLAGLSYRIKDYLV